MNPRAIAAAAVVIQIASVGHAHAQSADGLQIAIFGSEVTKAGGERMRRTGWIGAANFGKTVSQTIRARDCTSGVGSTNYLGGRTERTVRPEGQMTTTDSVWVVEATPLNVAGDAVTFRLRWVRARDNGRPSTQPSGEMELTLRPGQSMPLDLVTGPPPAGSTERCVRSLRVGVERDPEPDRDPRLLAADIWLVDRRPDGTEVSQALSLRGLYYQPIPFYFDRISQGAMSLDLFGDVHVTPVAKDRGAATVALKGRIINPALAFLPSGSDYVASTSVTTPLVAGEVVSVALPEIGYGTSPALVGHTLSLRIRFRQIR